MRLFPAILFFAVSLFAAGDPAYVARGKEVEGYYRQYTARFGKVFDDLKSALKQHAPELAGRLKVLPPAPVKQGYQVLPKITEDPALTVSLVPETPKPPSSVPYSWKRSRMFIDKEIPRIEEQEEKLHVLSRLGPRERKNVLERMVEEYPILEDNQRLIDHHIQYNRFWQKSIHDDRARFDRLTLLHDAVVEREELLAREKLNGSNPVTSGRIRELNAQIRAEGIEKLKLPGFARMRHPKKNLWILEIPVFTDIRDDAFIRRFKTEVERIWHYREKGGIARHAMQSAAPNPPEFQIRLEIKKIDARRLYPKTKPAPKPGDEIDVEFHAGLFPKNGALLTTGANSTYAIPNRYVALGPQDLSSRTAAHEFGHVIGFIDGYFRGYRDRGDEGYEVLEIVPDATDIMNNPVTGTVKLEHFEKILELSTRERSG